MIALKEVTKQVPTIPSMPRYHPLNDLASEAETSLDSRKAHLKQVTPVRPLLKTLVVAAVGLLTGFGLALIVSFRLGQHALPQESAPADVLPFIGE